MRDDIEEFVATRKMQKALDLTDQTRQHFNHNEYPHYFTGKLDANVVLVHLNPRQAKNDADTYGGTLWWSNFEEYFDYFQHFGGIRYGKQSGRSHKSPFDHKQIRFLRPFNVIDFVDAANKEDVYTNLERVIDNKLQLELIPYGSESFSTRGFTPDIVRPYMERVLDVVSAYPREYILFCGRIFDDLLQPYVSESETFIFKLTKNSGEPSKNSARFARLDLEYKGTKIKAGLASSFAQQGIPMADYGKQCSLLY